MSNTDDIIDTEPDAPAQEVVAFAAPPKTWQGIPLAPLAIDREGAWRLHRHMMGAPPLQDIIESREAIALDAMRVLWFCSNDPKEWIEATDGERGPDLRWTRYTASERAFKLESRIMEWSKANITGDQIPEAVELFYEIFVAAHSTRATIASDGKARGMGN